MKLNPYTDPLYQVRATVRQSIAPGEVVPVLLPPLFSVLLCPFS